MQKKNQNKTKQNEGTFDKFTRLIQQATSTCSNNILSFFLFVTYLLLLRSVMSSGVICKMEVK